MTIEELRQGSVIHYPYRWRHQIDGAPFPKDRPSCIVIRLNLAEGYYGYAIAAISDQEPQEKFAGLEIPPRELTLGGLDPNRRAFLHLSEVNIDDTYNSYWLQFRMPVRGRFSAKFMKKATGLLHQNLKLKRAFVINRKDG